MTGTFGNLVNHLLALETRLCEVDVVADLTWNQENGPLARSNGAWKLYLFFLIPLVALLLKTLNVKPATQ